MNTRVKKEKRGSCMIYNEEVKDLLITLDKSYQKADEETFHAALARLETLIPTVDPLTLEGINSFLTDLGSWTIDSVKILNFN